MEALPLSKRSCVEVSSGRWRPGARVGVIGGLGEMGRLFARFFRESGYDVLVSDRDSHPDNREVMQQADVVLFALPLHLTVPLMRELVPLAHPGQLLMDLTSLKAEPVDEMLRSEADVVGLHPMFGGRVESLAGQTLIACPVRISSGDWAGLRSLFEAAGLRIKETTPEDHDRLMSVVQVLFHVTALLSGRVLRELGVDVNEALEVASPATRVKLLLIGRMLAQKAELYSAIMEMNPHTPEVLACLREALVAVEEWTANRDLGPLSEDFEKSARHLGDFCRRAFKESSEVLDFAVKLARSGEDR